MRTNIQALHIQTTPYIHMPFRWQSYVFFLQDAEIEKHNYI